MKTETTPTQSNCAALLILVGFAMVVVGARFIFEPPVFQSKAIVKIRGNVSESEIAESKIDLQGVTWSVASEIAKVRSTVVLARVAEQLGLGKRWRGTLDSVLSRDEVLSRLRQRIHVTVPEGSNLMELTAWSSDPTEAAEIANSVAETYVQFVADSIARTRGDLVGLLRQNLAWQTTAAANLRKRIEQLRADTQRQKTTNSVANLESPAGARVHALAGELARVEANLIDAESRWEQLRGLDNTALREILPTMFPNELILPQLMAELAVIEREIETAQSENQVENEELETLIQTRNELQERIDNRVSELVAVIQTELENLRAQGAKLKAELDLARMPSTGPSEHAAALAQLEQELAAREKACEELQLRIFNEEIKTAEIRTSLQPEVIQPAEVPERPVKSRRSTGAILSIAGFGVMGTGALRKTRRGIHRSKDLPSIGVGSF